MQTVLGQVNDIKMVHNFEKLKKNNNAKEDITGYINEVTFFLRL